MLNNKYTDFIQTIPKIDLHCHLDGSFSSDFIKMKLDKKSHVFTDDAELYSRLHAPHDCSSLKDYLTCFDIPIECMQTYDNLRDGVLDLLEQAHSENVKYIEIRFAPACSLNEQLKYRDIYEAVIYGSQIGLQRYGIHSNIIVCAMRHHDEATNLAMLKASREYLNEGICALDLAGDEAAFPNNRFHYLFSTAVNYDMPFTIHSGECGSAENIKCAIEMGAVRIGHGIALYKDSALMKLCAKKHIGIEMCPTSNYQTKAVKPGEIYPLKQYLNQGLAVTINTDNRTVSNTTLSNEYNLLLEKFNITKEDIITMYKNSVDISYANDSVKNELYKYVIGLSV